MRQERPREKQVWREDEEFSFKLVGFEILRRHTNKNVKQVLAIPLWISGERSKLKK